MDKIKRQAFEVFKLNTKGKSITVNKAMEDAYNAVSSQFLATTDDIFKKAEEMNEFEREIKGHLLDQLDQLNNEE